MACVVDLDAENKLLKSQIQAFKLELEDKESQLTMSANLGNELLESNNQLNRYLEEIQESHLQELEELRQENYTLKLKIDQATRGQQNFANEMETAKEKLVQSLKQELARQENIHDKKVEEHQAVIESLQSELEKNSLVNEQLCAKILKQEKMLADAHKYSKQIQGMGALESQLEDMKEECTSMRLKKEEMKIMLNDANAEKEQLLFDKQNLVQKVDMLKENLEETSGQGKIWFDALQTSRQELSELHLENSSLKADAMNRSHKEKGNSLFGEVEDKRLELEQKHTALSAKYKSLSTTYQITKKQLIELKTRILPMLTMVGNKAENSKIKRLEAALIQSKSEIQSLHGKIEDLDKEKNGRGRNSELLTIHDVFTDFKEKKDYVAYLQDEIKNLNEAIECLKSKNAVTMIKLTGETDKRRQVESHLHSAEVENEKLKLERVRLQIKMDELKMKLQQEEVPEASLKRNKSSRSSLWKDVSLFAKPEDAKKNDTAAENENKTVSSKPPAIGKSTTDNASDQTSHQILSTKQPKTIEVITPGVKRSPGRTKEDVEQQPESTQVDENREIESSEPGDNIENRSPPSKEHNQSVKTVNPRRVIRVRRDAGKSECQQQ